LGEEAGEVGWVFFIRMELLQPLKDRLFKEGITPQELIHLGADLCEALEACAENGIVHRDVKPENIFYSCRDRKYKLGDFGISCYLSRPTEGKGLPGTLTHMSPEVYRGEPFTPAGDLYAAGMVLFKILNDNRIPFLPPYPIPFSPAERERALGVRLQGAPVGPPTASSLPDAERNPTLRIDTNVDPAVREVLQDLGFISQKAIASDPSERYQSAAEMREALEAVLKKYY
jgi:serine/threonine protein kinase